MTFRTLMCMTLAAALASSVLAAQPSANPQVNINTATAQELQLLPRVGAALAQRIVNFRAANGPFKAPEELARVKGVGQKNFSRLQSYVTVTGSTTLKEKVHSPRASKPADKTKG